MRRPLLIVFAVLMPLTAMADETVVARILDAHILPRFEELAEQSDRLSKFAQETCAPDAPNLRTAYNAAFDAWVSASHLRLGPTEVDDRAFALAFWPDARGATPRALSALIASQVPIGASPADYAQVSIAARGFYALEFLLYDPAFSGTENEMYRCTLIRTITKDIKGTTTAIFEDWNADYADRLLNPSAAGTYRSEEEALQVLFKALVTGLQFTSETRLGRPLGTFDRPRPTRAEAWRSGRSARHVGLSLEALRDLALHLSQGSDALNSGIDTGFDQALTRLAALDDPIFAGVSAPQSRLKIEVLQQSVEAIHALVLNKLGPTLGVAVGFNALDGD